MTDYRVLAGQTVTDISLLNAGDTMEVYTGGAAVSTSAIFGAQQTVYAGGVASHSTFSYSAQQLVMAGGQSIDDLIYRLSTQTLYGTATGTTVSADASQVVYGAVSGATVQSDVFQGGSGVTQSGQQTIYGTAQDTVLTGGVQTVYGTARNTTVRYGRQTVAAGGTAVDTTLGDGGRTVSPGRPTLQLQAGASTGGTITFANLGTLEIDAVPQGDGAFATPLAGFAQGDAIDLTGLAFSAATTATLSGDVLTVRNGTTSEAFTLRNSSATMITVSQDAVGGTLLTGAVPADAVSFSPQVTYGDGVFTLTGSAFSAAGVRSVEIVAQVDGVATDLGAAAVDANGTFSFAEAVGDQQTFFQAVLTDGAGGTAISADAGFNLQGGLGPRGRYGEQKSFGATDEASTAVFRPDGQRFLSLESPGQTVGLGFNDIVASHHTGANTFVFTPGDGVAVIGGFKLGGADHDTLQLPSSEFQNFAAVLRHTAYADGSATVTDPRTGEGVVLQGVTEAALKAHPKDFTFV